jgi:hypothetical protein
MNLAPIVLFVYNRPQHTIETVEALLKNKLARESDLIVYCDAPKNIEATHQVTKVREFVKGIKGFGSLKIIEREKNIGLASSIIDGVTSVVNEYGKIIVLEDDLVTSPYFLSFMNKALDHYQNIKEVWHISGWNYPIDTSGINDAFLWRTMNCWGWATWKDRWGYFEKNTESLLDSFSKTEIYKFNLDGKENFWSQVISNHKGKINTWAIYWYATIFKMKGLCLNPSQTFINNIGVDGSGVNCGQIDLYKNNLNTTENVNFTNEIVENILAVERIKFFCKSKKKPFLVRGINKITRLTIGKNIIK